MDSVGIFKKDQTDLFQAAAAILHLGNVAFEKPDNGDGAIVKQGTAQQGKSNYIRVEF
jgi:myosin heavy subunit